MGNSLRELTNHQFANGNTIDGVRIDAALQDVLDRFNALLPKDLSRRWVPTRFVGGQMNSRPTLNVQAQLPWLEHHNAQANTIGGTKPVLGYQSSYRVKGSANPHINHNDADATDKQYVYTTALTFTGPAVLHSYALTLNTDLTSTFLNNFQWTGANRPSGTALNEYLKDLVLEISIDSPYAPEDRARTSVAVKKAAFSLEAELFSRGGQQVPADDMVPPSASLDGAGGSYAPHGLHLEARHLNIPVPQESRVRISIVIPKYRDTYVDNGWQQGDPATRVWGQQYISWTLCVLEPISK